MKPVFKCDYCDFIGTEQEVKEHEVKCTDNYDRRSCYTCEYKIFNKKLTGYECTEGREIPEGQIYEFCGKYKRKPKSDNAWQDLMDVMTGRMR
jgi:hypothetical protein